MGFLRKVFKKVGRGIKKAFKSFGKFMGKIGILGQVAMLFILPGIGNALASGLGSALGLQGVTGMSSLVGAAGTATSAGTGLLGATGAGASILQGAGKVLQFAGKVASMPGKVFSSVTQGVTSTLKEFSKTALSKIAPNSTFAQGAAENFFFGADSAASRVGKAFKSPFTDEAVAKVAEDIVTEQDKYTIKLEPRPDSEIQDAFYDTSPLTSKERTRLSEMGMDSLLEQPQASVDTGVSKEGYVSQVLKGAREEFSSKLDTLRTDPYQATKAALGAITANQQEQDFAAQQAAMAASMSGEVINLGIYQDPGAFQTYAMQNTVAPIQGLQAPATYNAPISSWGQQFMFDPFNPQMARGIS
tara:strand:+ start:1078 stop:2154 length:1077 start_codon:yes stop_codon:yes gene_type:complete